MSLRETGMGASWMAIGRLKSVWSWLIQPATSIQDSENRHHARLLASMLLTLVPLGLLVAALPVFFYPDRSFFQDNDLLVLIGGTFFWTAAYILNRAGHPKIAAMSAVSIAYVAIMATVVTDNNPEDAPFVIMPILITSLIFSLETTVVFATVNLATILLLPVFTAEITYPDILGSSGFVFFGSTLILVVTRHRDRLERNRQAELAKNEERYALAAQAAKGGVWDWNLETGEFYLDPNIKAALGYNDGEIPNDLEVWTTYVHPKDRQPVMEAAQAHFEGRTPEYIFEHRMLHKNGSVRWILVRGQAHRDEQGNVVRMVGTDTDITDRKQVEEQLHCSLREKDVLLREIHHRVKNNLQTVISLLNLQSSAFKDPLVKQAFQDSKDRVRTMALVHEKLYQSQDLAVIDAADYVPSLAEHLFGIYGGVERRISLNVQVDDVSLSIDEAIPCSLIINELVTNALKHAFQEGKAGQICIELLSREDNQITLVVSDDGVGLPPDLDLQSPLSLGLELVSILSQQLGGAVEVEKKDGTTFKIAFAQG